MRKRFCVRVSVLMAAAILACGAGLPAMAQEGYAGASYIDASGEFFSGTNSFSADSSGWKIFGGYDFHKFVGMELTYYDLGSFEDTQGNNTFAADVTVFDLGFRGILPLGERFQLFAKLGYSNVDVDTSQSGTLGTASSSGDYWEVMYGLGVAWKIGDKFGIRAEWESWDVAGKLDEYSLGAYFRFGKR